VQTIVENPASSKFDSQAVEMNQHVLNHFSTAHNEQFAAVAELVAEKINEYGNRLSLSLP
jgi:hypothetical protein